MQKDRSYPRLQGNQRLYQVVARQIAKLIEQNAADKSWRMPSERELAEELSVSRPVVREAVIALEMRGIVEVRGRAGIMVLPSRLSQVNFELSVSDIGPGPFELLEEEKYSKPSRPVSCCSMTCVTLFSTVSAEAPT